MSQFIILTLPRSRSAWLAKFLSYGSATCGHDVAAYCSSISEWIAKFALLNGVVETGAVVGWRVLRQMVPHAKLLIVRRPVKQVLASFNRLGVQIDVAELFHRSIALDMVATLPDVEVFEYEELVSEDSCARLFEHCLNIPHNHNWWAALAQMNVQIDMQERLEHLQTCQRQLSSFRQEVEGLSAGIVVRGLN